MLIGSLLWPILLRKYELRKEQRLEQKRQDCYDSYLREQQSLLQQLLAQATQKLRQLYVSDPAKALWQYELPQTETLVCIGIGDIPMVNPYVANEAPLQIQEDAAEVKKQAFLAQPLYLRQVPVVCVMKQFQCHHVSGEYAHQCVYAKYLLYHHVLLYAPHASHVLIAYTQKEADWIPRFLPHLFHESGYRFLCCDIQTLSKALMYLHQSPLPTLALSFAAVFTDFIIQNAQALPMILFSFTAHAQKEDGITITAQQGKCDHQAFTWQGISCFQAAMSQLCNIDHEHHKKGFPSRLSFLAMYHVTQIAHLQIEKRWYRKKYEPSLQAFLGVSEDGEVLCLDLHERMHGPHGIVAGMTGSGKSELLITLLLSLAVNYHPYDCAFILIDYKGGGMAKALANLPHIAGVITNLDGNMINRSLASLQVEVIRRQQLFARVMENGGYPSMDIDIYQKLYHEHSVDEIVPHLVIVADEFAELKQQEPQFMEQLIRIARIGRSLGIHLILATQKPSGIVDDQIWSNARFHICLKVAQQNDSIDMLKRKEGAQIKAVGRFYLQVGYDEVFIQGQSGYAKLPYDPKECGLGQALIQELADDGSVKREWHRTYTQAIQSEMNALIEEMKRLADQREIQTPHLWLPPLANAISLHTLPQGSFAMVDDPMQKRQFPLMIEECLCNTVFLAHDTLCLQKALHAYISALCSSEVISAWRMVIIDAANGQLCRWKANRHVYAAITPEAKDDLLFVMQHMKSLRLQRNKAAQWLLVIHNIGGLLDAWEDGASWLTALARDHGNNGIHVLISAMSLTDIQSRLFQQFENLFVFHLQDEQEARSLVQLALPSKPPLRAMWKKQERLLEVQFSSSDEIVTDDNQQLAQLPLLETQPLYRNLEKESGENGLIIGRSLAKRSVVALPLQGNWLISGSQWKEFYQLLQQIAQIKQYPIHFSDRLREIPHEGMHIFALPISELSANFHHPLIQSCTMAQSVLWSGLGLEENRYLWNLNNHFENKRRQDICWIKEEPLLIRRVFAYE